MFRRLGGGVVLVAVVIGVAGASPAAADDPPPVSPPPGVSQPPTPSGSPTPGPVYIITPGVGGSELGAPTDQEAVDQAKAADQRAARNGARSGQPGTAGAPSGARPGAPAASSGVPGTGAEVPSLTGGGLAGPQTPLVTPATRTPEVGLLLRLFAAFVTMLVMFEITAVRRYVTAGRPTR